MNDFKSNDRGDEISQLSLEPYLELVKDYRDKAIKVYQMGGPKSHAKYVLNALQALLQALLDALYGTQDIKSARTYVNFLQPRSESKSTQNLNNKDELEKRTLKR
jgi:hypothetical protein